ncbi:T9SS type A sorting domain-containing protein [Pontibacter harenae]|uniref:T9SS type A sorting domain-containing protein n=1 Tax=Pontibacter harenae TaxID=2894083 RepID=UPI001E3AF9CC|nr:T9SS type A sorting domain-containing protein [Pontibacter harenae]MCC9166277.1 T9SS type A sorting domain-containing protein [Pontibacter harenae]
MDWGPVFTDKGWKSIENDVAHALIAFDIIGEHVVNDKVDFTLFWNTRFFDYKDENNVPIYNALASDGSSQANGLALSIWGKYLLDNVGAVSDGADSSYVVTYATKTSSNDKLNVFLLNKHNSESKTISLSLDNFSSNGVAVVSEYKGTSIYDTAPIFNSIGNITAADNTYTVKTAPASITVLEFSTKTYPVELTHFNAVQKGNHVQLTWQTASERNNAGFEVQVYYNDAKSFKPLTFVESLAGGNSMQTTSYSYLNKEAYHNGTHYYRLKQIDLDGQTTYSAVKAVEFEFQDQTTVVYPNPFESSFSFKTTSKTAEYINVSILNTLGKSVFEKKVKLHEGENTVPVELGKNCAAGLYFLRLKSANNRQTLKILKL